MSKFVDRRSFIGQSVAGLAALSLANARADERKPAGKPIRVGVIGCGSVARKYFPNLAASPHVELVSACDIIFPRAQDRASAFHVPNSYPNIDEMLAGAAFDLFVNLTEMQEHEELNRRALNAGKHVWSEKPIANSLAAGQELLDLSRKKGVRLWGAPTAVQSPQFEYMAKEIQSGRLGKISVGQGSYGHGGPDWADFFYAANGGSLPDLGVYNLTTLTGLLGPAKSVVAMTSVVTPVRQIRDKGEVPVVAEDNSVVVMDHGNGRLSHIECGFNYFTPYDHNERDQSHRTITITGSQGVISMVGYDWAPLGVDIANFANSHQTRVAAEPHDYVWECGATMVAECLATGREPRFTPEHALHVVEIMSAANLSQSTGRRIALTSSFKWPVVSEI